MLRRSNRRGGIYRAASVQNARYTRDGEGLKGEVTVRSGLLSGKQEGARRAGVIFVEGMMHEMWGDRDEIGNESTDGQHAHDACAQQRLTAHPTTAAHDTLPLTR